jgi:hypothetical protein
MTVTLWAQLPASIAGSWLKGHRQTYHAVWPQSWSFFASAADNDITTVYPMRADGTAAPSPTEPMMSRQNTWGLGRATQGRLVETLGLTAQIPADYWVPCERPLSRPCLVTTRVFRMTNEYRPATLCGRMVFVRTAPMSITANSTFDERPGSVAAVDLVCGR